MNIGIRLRHAIKSRYKSLKEFSDKTGIAYRTLQGYLAGTREPEAEQLAKIYARSNINIGWLLTGEGPVYLDSLEYIKQAFQEDSEKERIKKWIDDFWQKSRDKERHWLEMQLELNFPQYREWRQQKGGSTRVHMVHEA